MALAHDRPSPTFMNGLFFFRRVAFSLALGCVSVVLSSHSSLALQCSGGDEPTGLGGQLVTVGSELVRVEFGMTSADALGSRYLYAEVARSWGRAMPEPGVIESEVAVAGFTLNHVVGPVGLDRPGRNPYPEELSTAFVFDGPPTLPDSLDVTVRVGSNSVTFRHDMECEGFRSRENGPVEAGPAELLLFTPQVLDKP